MQHSQFRRPSETVKFFTKSLNATHTLIVYEFVNGSLLDITPEYIVEALNPGYFSSEIQVPGHSCYLLALFDGNPIVIRVGEPDLQFFYWAKRQKSYAYNHFDEFGVKLDSGLLNSLGSGFYYTTPISDVLGYIEVAKKPYIIHVPYCSVNSGVSIDIDWQRTIVRQTFGVNEKGYKFKLNIMKSNFYVRKSKHRFVMKKIQERFGVETQKLQFKVYCRR